MRLLKWLRRFFLRSAGVIGPGEADVRGVGPATPPEEFEEEAPEPPRRGVAPR